MKVFFLAVIFMISSFAGMAQTSDMAVLKQHTQKYETMEMAQSKRIVKFQKTYNPVKLLLYLPLFVYQKVVSEQISASCSFEPSCSAFSILAIKKLGFIKGLFLTADRLTRCNGQAQEESEFYLYDPIKSKVFDDPEMYRLKN